MPFLIFSDPMGLHFIEVDGRPKRKMVDDHDLGLSDWKKSTARLLVFKVFVYGDPVKLEPGTNFTH